MAESTSLADRIRSLVGIDEVEPSRFPFLRKLERAEEDVALMRLAVVLLNGLAFFGLRVQGRPAPTTAVVVLAVAFVYSVAVVLLEAQPSFGNVSWSMVTVGLDVLAISAWLAATGGWTSPYFPLWYASIAAVGYRYNLPLTTGVSTAYVGAYAGLCVATGGVGSWIEFGVRALYIPLTGAIVGLAAEGYVDAAHEHRDAQRRLVDAIETMDRRFAAVLEDAPDRIVLTDTDGAVEYANGSVAEIGLAHPTDRRAAGIHDAAIQSAIADEDVVEYLASPEGSGARARYWCRAAPICDDGNPVGAVVAARRAPETLDLAENPDM